MKAILSLEDDDGLRCVDIIAADGGAFTFKEFRKDVEEPGRWYLVHDYSNKNYASKMETIAAAAAHTLCCGKSSNAKAIAGFRPLSDSDRMAGPPRILA